MTSPRSVTAFGPSTAGSPVPGADFAELRGCRSGVAIARTRATRCASEAEYTVGTSKSLKSVDDGADCVKMNR